ncbi:MAG: cytochrome P450 [Burkholderiaceae bacterium]
MKPEFNPADIATMSDPFPSLAVLREQDPAHYSSHLKAWLVTRYDDTKRLTQDMSLSSDRLRPFFATLEASERDRITDIIRYLSLWMVFTDAPDHTRLRRLTSHVFNAPLMNGMRALIERRVDHLLDALDGQEQINFIKDFAGPLPALVIMDMLGVPGSELGRIKTLSDQIALFIGSARASEEKYNIAQAATREMADLFLDLIAARRSEPTNDLISQLVHLQEKDTGDRLTDDELVATFILLLFAGHETTTSLLSNGLLAMLQFPEQMQVLRDNPTLASDAVEEVLRFDGPNLSQARVAIAPVPLHDKTIEPGDRVFLMLSAANRDPRIYSNPDRLHFERERVAHLAFGWGKHICLGFPLARLEGQVAFPKLLARWPKIELADQPLNWHRSMVFRGVPDMPLRVAH